MDCRERILSEDYFDVIADFQLGLSSEPLYDFCDIDIEDLFSLIYFNKNTLTDANDYFYDYRSVPKLYGLMQQGESAFDPNSLIVSGITQIQREPLQLTGRGCVIVLIDTGIRYTDAVFRNLDGSTRILAIWDQTIQIGTPPEGFFYGTQYTKEEIDRALQTEDPYAVVPSRDENGHGTNLAAVAAGSRLENGMGYLGAAPEADIVVVKLKQCKQYLREFYLIPENAPAYQENDIMLAVKYGESFARTFRRPVVFCIGLGTNYGDHAGSSPLSRYLSAIAVRRSRAVVVCGGNEGNAAHHYQEMMDQRRSGEENRTAVEVRVGENAQGFLLEFWGNVPDVFTISVRSPGGETVPAIRLGIRDVITYSFVYERTRITIAGELVEPASGEELILMRVQSPTPGIWTFFVEPAREIHNGLFHMWLPLTQFMNSDNFFLEPNPDITLTEPGMASDVITVSTYDSANNSFYVQSGRGFTRDGRIKPDFSAPGVNISVPREKATGSSLAAAITAGAVAQFMQWAVVEGNNSVVESREIRNYFVRGASRDPEVIYPNREWGYGRLNMVGTFDALIGV